MREVCGDLRVCGCEPNEIRPGDGSRRTAASAAMAQPQPTFSSDLQYNTDKSAATLVYHPLQGFLQFHPCINGHLVKLIVKSLVDK